MPVRAASNASVEFQATLEQFKNAFSLTEKGEFKTSVAKTKGEFYVKGSKLCSANIHGGKGTVTSSVTNQALRKALVTAFSKSGATADFIDAMRKRLLSAEVQDAALSRQTVKELFNAFEIDKLGRQETVGQKAKDSLTDKTKQLSMDDFRVLARGSGFVFGEFAEDEEEEFGFVVFKHAETGDADYNAALRRGLYAAVKGAKVPAENKLNREILLERLARTLIAPQHLGKPLSCDEIRRTLVALDEGLGHVPPKALAARDIRALRTTGEKSDLVNSCEHCETDVRTIDGFLGLYGAQLKPAYVKALRSFAEVRREMSEIGRQALGQKIVDVDHAVARVTAVFDDFCRANPMTLMMLGTLWEFGTQIHESRARLQDGDKYTARADDVKKILTGESAYIDAEGNLSDLEVNNLDVYDFLQSVKEELLPILETKVFQDAYKCIPAHLEKLRAKARANDDGLVAANLALVANDLEKIEQSHVAAQLFSPLKGSVMLSSADLKDALAQVRESVPRLFNRATLASLEKARAKAENALQELSKFTRESLAFALSQGMPPNNPAGQAYRVAQNAQHEFVRKLQEVVKTVLQNEMEKQNPRVGPEDLKLDALLQRAERGAQGLDRLPSRVVAERERNGEYGMQLTPIDPSRLADELPDADEVSQFIEKNQDKFNNAVTEVCNNYTKIPGKKNEVSDTTRTIIEQVLRHGIAGAFAEKGGEPGPELWEEGSVIDSLKKLYQFESGLGTGNIPHPGNLASALSLPPAAVRAFLRACLMIRGGSETGLFPSFATAADKLSRLPPDMLTPLNILKLAQPELEILKENVQGFNDPSNPLTAEQVKIVRKEAENFLTGFMDEINKVRDDQVKKEFCSKVILLPQLGFTMKKINKLYKAPGSFSLEMLPRNAFLPTIGVMSSTLEDAKNQFLKDVDRFKVHVTIDKPYGLPQYKMPEEMRRPFDKRSPALNDSVFNELKALCGAENQLQLRCILYFMSQCSMEPETLLSLARGNANDPTLKDYHFSLRKDLTTGDVIVTKRVKVRPDDEFECEIRFGTNGSMTVVRAEELPVRAGTGID